MVRHILQPSNPSSMVKINVGLWSLLGLLFIALKLTEQITWAWVWVLAPFWMPIAASIATVVIVCAVTVLAMFINALK